MEKLYLCIFAIIFFAMVTIPLIAVETDKKEIAVEKAGIIDKKQQTDEGKIKVYMSDNKQVKSVSLTEYLVGVCLTEMDESYPDEAIKAQAVAAHTLLLYRQKENADKNYDITDDYSVDQGYLDKNGRKEKYGDDLEKIEPKVEKLVKSVENKIIYYKNEPILAVYHDTSGGKTENAKDIWGGNYPYLVSVESISDLLNPAYMSTVTYTKQEFLSRLKQLDISLSKQAKDYIGESKTTNSGTVKSIKIGTKSITGQKIREVFDLRSANFDLVYAENKFTFTVRGFGHGVGMSQYGALFMAKEGSTYEEILKWYYKGCKVK